MTEKIKSLYADEHQYEIINMAPAFCGDCKTCKNVCEFGIHSIASYDDARYAVGR